MKFFNQLASVGASEGGQVGSPWRYSKPASRGGPWLDQRRRAVGFRAQLTVARDRGEVLREVADPIEEALEVGQKLLQLEPDWDEAGSPGYEQATLERAGGFLRTLAVFASTSCGAKLNAPSVDPGPDGTIDLHWRSDDAELLINIPNDSSASAHFYGDDYGATMIKGELDPSAPDDDAHTLTLLTWLARKRR